MRCPGKTNNAFVQERDTLRPTFRCEICCEPKREDIAHRVRLNPYESQRSAVRRKNRAGVAQYGFRRRQPLRLSVFDRNQPDTRVVVHRWPSSERNPLSVGSPTETTRAEALQQWDVDIRKLPLSASQGGDEEETRFDL